MNRIFLLPNDQLDKESYSIKDSLRIDHILKTLKSKVNDLVKLVVINKGVCMGKITSLSHSEIRIIPNFSELKKPKREILLSLKIAASRPQTVKKIIEHGASLGVSSFSFYKAKLSEKSYLSSKVFQNKNYLEYLYLGLSQSANLYKLPNFEIEHAHDHSPLPPQSFILSTRVDKNFCNYKLDFDKQVTLILGPERGLTPEEEDDFISRGAKPVSIGKNILRVEIATFVTIGALHILKQQNIAYKK